MWHMVFGQKDSDKSFFAKVTPISFKDLTEGINWKLKSPQKNLGKQLLKPQST